MSAARKPDPTMKFTSADILLMPDDGKRYEVIEGELYASKQPNWHHQYACLRDDTLTSPLLPGFTCKVSELFHQIPKPAV
jgi:hypothetical protein